jgi:REP element-mobilizing transposase RayT
MARLARIVIPNVPHHITQRGNRRLPIFFCDEDRTAYLSLNSGDTLNSEFRGHNTNWI